MTAKPTSKNAPASGKDAKGEKKAAEAEKEEEAPKDAEPDTGSKGALKLGDKLPKISIEDNEGKAVDVSGLAGKDRGVVLFLYPKVSGRSSRYKSVAYTDSSSQADTPGCTVQACGYRDVHEDIVALGYEVYGLSKDKPAAQQKVRRVSVSRTSPRADSHLLVVMIADVATVDHQERAQLQTPL